MYKYSHFRINTSCLEGAVKLNINILEDTARGIIDKFKKKGDNFKIYIQALDELIKEQEQWNGMTKLNNNSLVDLEGKKIGEGNFGSVYKNKLKEGKDVAVKKISDEKKIQEFIKEAIITYQICNIEHDNIILMYGIVQNKQQTRYDGIILEFCSDGDLLKKIKYGNIDDDLKKKYIKGICDGMIQIHELGFVHRDLAPRNVLLKSDTPKICDFGLSRKKNRSGFYRGDSKVSIFWTDPSAMREEGVFNERTDIWSFGITFWQIFKNGEDIYFLYMSMLNYDKVNISQDIIESLKGDIDINIWNIIKKCFSKKGRFKNFQNIKEQLEQLEIL